MQSIYIRTYAKRWRGVQGSRKCVFVLRSLTRDEHIGLQAAVHGTHEVRFVQKAVDRYQNHLSTGNSYDRGGDSLTTACIARTA